MFRWKLFRFFTIDKVASSLEDNNALIVEQSPIPLIDETEPYHWPLYKLFSSLEFRLCATNSIKRPIVSQKRIVFMKPQNTLECFTMTKFEKLSTEQLKFGHAIFSFLNGTLCDFAIPLVADDFIIAVGYEAVRSSFSTLERQENVLKIYQWIPLEKDRLSTKVSNTDLFYEESVKLIVNIPIRYDSKPTTVAVDTECHNGAVGFLDGTVLVLIGNLKTNKTNKLRILPGAGETTGTLGVVFLSFDPFASHWIRDCSEIRLFLTTSSSIAVIRIRSLSEYRREVLERKGAEETRCCMFSHADSSLNELFVAREEAIYFFNADGRGQCVAFPCLESQVASKGDYILVCNEFDDGEWIVYDMKNKLVALREKAPVNRLACIGAFSCLDVSNLSEQIDNVTKRDLYFFIFGRDGSCFLLKERSIQERINLLLRKRFYEAALTLARTSSRSFSHQESCRQLMYDTLMEFGNYLLERGEFDEAANPLIEGISYGIPTSKVIRFLCEQPSTKRSLIRYLEALHLSGKASLSHTRVLLTCYKYERLGNASTSMLYDISIKEYIRSCLMQTELSTKEARKLCQLCIDAGLADIAQELSWSLELYDIFFELFLKNRQENVDEIFEELSKLEPLKVCEALEKYARRFFQCSSPSFIKFLSEWTCRLFVAPLDSNTIWETFLRTIYLIYVDNPRGLVKYLEHLLSSEVDSQRFVWDSKMIRRFLFEATLLMDTVQLPNQEKMEENTCNMLTRMNEKYILSHLYDSSLTVGSLPTRHQRVLYKKAGKKALNLLQSARGAIDEMEGLSLAELYGHMPCLEYLYERLKKYSDLTHVLLLQEDAQSLLRACRRHGIREPTLWIQALQFFAEKYNKEDVLVDEQKITAALQEAIEAVTRSGMLTPLSIVQMLMTYSEGKIPLYIIQNYMERTLSSLRYALEEEEATIQTLEGQIRSLTEERNHLSSSVIIFQNERCSKCGVELTIPMVHFMCQHSYHIDCLVDVQSTSVLKGTMAATMTSPSQSVELRTDTASLNCPLCEREFEGIQSLKAAFEDKRQQPEEFFRFISNSKDGFNVVVEFLGRCVFPS
eukprot:jgi/Galph1/4192/GphlegSOOS_G2796.1